MPSYRIIIALLLLVLPTTSFAAESPFRDVQADTEVADAVILLKKRGIIEGRPDGTFGPDDLVNRAEAVTIIVRAVANAQNLPPLTNCFPDVGVGYWYVKPVCYAKDLSWVAGYPDGTFQPVRTVKKAEYLKILLRAYGVDIDQIMGESQPLSRDVSSTDLWYFPFYAYAVRSGMTQVDLAGDLNPGLELTRGQVALLTYRFLLFREGENTQRILANMERDIRSAIAHLENLNVEDARFAANRSQLTSSSVRELLPDHTLAKSTAPLVLAIDTLATAYALVRQNNFESALIHTQNAFHRASDADKLDESVKVYTDKIRNMAHALAESIREHQSGE